MAKNFNNRALAVSQKIYGRLLLAYPKAHREEYGPAMAQLFRDECRDAWNESQSWGVAKLWLRVLPDLVKTSITERLAALNERKSMFDKMTALIQPRTAFLKVFVVVFLLILCASVAITFLLPEIYASTARIQVEPDEAVRGASSYDPYFIQTTFEVMNSQLVLEPVVDKLKLNAMWGKKYNNGAPLKTSNTLEILQKRITLTPIRNTKLVSITVYSDDKKEAAQIANAIAESYRDYRIKFRAEAEAKAGEPMQKQYQKQYQQEGERIQQVQADMDSLRQQFKIGSDVSANPSPEEKLYWEKKMNLDQLYDSHRLLNAKIVIDTIVAQIPKTSMVQVIDRAEPGKAPVKPNKTLNIAFGIVAGIILASIAGGISVFIALKFRKKIGKTAATA